MNLLARLRFAAPRPGVFAAACLLSSCLIGCGKPGPQRVAVEGTVTLDGEPLATGQIMFIPEGSHRGPMAGGIVENGRYRIEPQDGPTIGLHRVEIRDEDPFVAAYREKSDNASFRDVRPAAKVVVPPRYREQSPLRAETRDELVNQFDFALTSRP